MMGERNGVHPACASFEDVVRESHRPVKGRNHGFEVVLASMKNYHGMFIWLWAPFGSWIVFLLSSFFSGFALPITVWLRF